MLNVCVLKIGEVEQFVIDIINEGLLKFHNWNVKILSHQIPIPKSSYNPIRKQFNSSLIIDEISKLKKENCNFILAVTEVDLYVHGLNFVFGEARPSEGIAIISTARLKNEFYGRKRDEKIYAVRILTEAVHEIGHLLGLGHCPRTDCVMFFSNSITDTDRKGFKFCERCSSIVESRIKKLK